MIKTLSPTTTAEIMSRYRPIAPRPIDDGATTNGLVASPHNRYLQTAHPTGTRKRRRGAAGISPSAIKRRRASRCAVPDKAISLQRYTQCAPPLVSIETHQMILSWPQPMIQMPPLIEEKDLRLELKQPGSTSVISPQPVRPVGSTIRVGFINKEELLHAESAEEKRRPEELEKEMEAEELPAIISDSNNRVRMANSAYKEMVGQPECPWLDSTIGGQTGDGKDGRRRISGEVVIQDVSGTGLPVTESQGFSCWARIEWKTKGVKRWINAFGEVMRLCCDSKDYLLTWRFHVKEKDECSLDLGTFV